MIDWMNTVQTTGHVACEVILTLSEMNRQQGQHYHSN
jgi:hypothetical protein